MPDAKNAKCRHIFHDGHSCGSPALRNEEFCYYHHNTRKPRKGPPLADASSAFDLPIPEDRSAIQASIAIIVQRVAAGSLDARRASILLRALKLAQQTLTFMGPPKSLSPVTELPAVEVDTRENNPTEEPYNHEYNPELERSLWSPDPVAAYLSSVQAVEEPVLPSVRLGAPSSRGFIPQAGAPARRTCSLGWSVGYRLRKQPPSSSPWHHFVLKRRVDSVTVEARKSPTPFRGGAS